MASLRFRFKKFSVGQEGVPHPVGTDSVLLGAWAPVAGTQNVLDIGTGTGVVALMLAQRSERAVITAVEIDRDAADCAAANFEASPWVHRLALHADAIQNFSQTAVNQFDLIVSNPPFFTETSVSADVRRRLGRNTDSLSQDALLDAVARLLAPGGSFCVVLPPVEGRRLIELAVTKRLYCNEETQVRARPGKSVERLLLRFTRDPRLFHRTALAIYSHDEVYSPDFQALTKDFYVFF